ncbi:uncharacterized protein KD926_001785 [Aspergillus affinis]|uniref:uncharacterized protein n=1 Tax=Aspergillus affinis TaxID=1070780 RepID=UPI0022FECC77|nr:uncharacterized protein KD926_001785 [Aspergillus affinis]KAI9036442.1 hypothetical protein KD926_001785 [Aspergillus affinis]
MDDLKRAIYSASSATLRSTLEIVCTKDPTFRQKLADLLLVSEDQVPDVPSDVPPSDYESSEEEPSDEESSAQDAARKQPPRSENPNGPQQVAGSKRSMPRYATCTNCKEEFDVTENTRKSCVYHPDCGYPDEDDFFVDHDENCHGPMDTEENRMAYPEGFIYECCNGNGKEPCTTDWHREAEPMKRRRAQ